MIEEAHDREDRLHKKLESLHFQAQLALKEKETHEENEKEEESKSVAPQTSQMRTSAEFF